MLRPCTATPTANKPHVAQEQNWVALGVGGGRSFEPHDCFKMDQDSQIIQVVAYQKATRRKDLVSGLVGVPLSGCVTHPVLTVCSGTSRGLGCDSWD